MESDSDSGCEFEGPLGSGFAGVAAFKFTVCLVYFGIQKLEKDGWIRRGENWPTSGKNRESTLRLVIALHREFGANNCAK